MPVDSILGQYEADQAAKVAPTDRVATDKDTFLKLLVAQLTHQDPLNPVEDKEFIAQLAQFTSVEELQNLNTGMQNLNNAYLMQQSTSAAALIGRYVTAPGNMVTIMGIGTDQATSSYIYYDLPRDAASIDMEVYSLDADGKPVSLVASRSLKPQAAGKNYPAQWNGTDNNGNPMPDGIYQVTIAAKDIDGNGMLVPTTSIGKVYRVEIADDGNHNLVLEDFRSVKFNELTYVDDVALHESSSDSNSLSAAQKAYEEVKVIAEAAARNLTNAQNAAANAQNAYDSAEAAATANPADEDAQEALEKAEEELEKAQELLEEAQEDAEEAEELLAKASQNLLDVVG